jgi:ribosome-binding factor A
MSQRTERVDELLRQEIGALLAKEVADPRIGFATITDIETSPDLRHAKVWVSVIGQKGDRDGTVRALENAMPFIRHELGRRLRIRRIPELHVRLDDSAERGTRVLHLLQELEAGVEPEAIAPINESLPTPVPRLPHEGDALAEPDGDVTGAAHKKPGVRRSYNWHRPGGTGKPGRGTSAGSHRRSGNAGKAGKSGKPGNGGKPGTTRG